MNNYTALPTLQEARLMVTWTSCPVHGEMVGLDRDGHVIGHCAACMAEAARGLRFLESEEQI